MKGFKLTERQKAFAEQHHYILVNFLKYRGLSVDEYYDVVVFRFLLAVKQYDERENLRKHSFITVANNHMRSALGNHFKSTSKNKVKLISLDENLPNSRFTYKDYLADTRVNVCDEVCERLSSAPNMRKGLHKHFRLSTRRCKLKKEVYCL